MLIDENEHDGRAGCARKNDEDFEAVGGSIDGPVSRAVLGAPSLHLQDRKLLFLFIVSLLVAQRRASPYLSYIHLSASSPAESSRRPASVSCSSALSASSLRSRAVRSASCFCSQFGAGSLYVFRPPAAGDSDRLKASKLADAGDRLMKLTKTRRGLELRLCTERDAVAESSDLIRGDPRDF